MMNFFDSYYEVAQKMKSKAARQEFLAAIIDYYYSGGKEPEFKNEVAEVGFAGIRLSIDNSIKNSRNRKKIDNEHETNAEPNQNETQTKTEPNENELKTKSEPDENQLPDEKEKEKEKEFTNVNSTPKAPYEEIVRMLNEATGAGYRTTSKKTRSLIDARFREGFTIDDFQTVIETKSAEWLNDSKMCQYLRPETLFGTKFESYLNTPRKVSNNGKNSEYAGTF